MINLIVAASENNVIGKDNTLPWKLSADLKMFKQLTTNNVVIMGRNTYESIGKFLPNRINMVLTSRAKDDIFAGYTNLPLTFVEYMGSKIPPNFFFNPTLEEAIDFAKDLFKEKEIFIIGGGQVYKEAIDKNIVDKIYLTKVHAKVEGDTYFNELDNNWKLSESNTFPADEKNQYEYSFEIWDKK